MDNMDAKKEEVKVPSDAAETLGQVFEALKEKGYDPVMQIIGYLLSEDPTYITNFNHARSLICKIDRDEILEEIVRFYFDQKKYG